MWNVQDPKDRGILERPCYFKVRHGRGKGARGQGGRGWEDLQLPGCWAGTTARVGRRQGDGLGLRCPGGPLRLSLLERHIQIDHQIGEPQDPEPSPSSGPAGGAIRFHRLRVHGRLRRERMDLERPSIPLVENGRHIGTRMPHRRNPGPNGKVRCFFERGGRRLRHHT